MVITVKLDIAGKDRTPDLVPEIERVAAERAKSQDAPSFCSEADSALSLRLATGESDYLARALGLMLRRSGLGAGEFMPDPEAGLLKRMLSRFRRITWRVIKYQPLSIVFHQNTVNMQITGALEFMRGEYSREICRLQGRIDELERQVKAVKTGGSV